MVGETNKVVIVTGGSSGIGRCTASALKENGCIVYEFSRRSIPMEGVTHLSVDVTGHPKRDQNRCSDQLCRLWHFRCGGVYVHGASQSTV